MRVVYRFINVALLFFGTLLAMFLSWAGIGTREGLKKAVEANPFQVFLPRFALAAAVMLAYSGLVYALNRTLFQTVSDPTKVFRVSAAWYLGLISLFVYLFVRIQ